jgi:hypothetical protein
METAYSSETSTFVTKLHGVDNQNTSLTAKLLLALASTEILDSESYGTHDHVLPSDFSGSHTRAP